MSTACSGTRACRSAPVSRRRRSLGTARGLETEVVDVAVERRVRLAHVARELVGRQVREEDRPHEVRHRRQLRRRLASDLSGAARSGRARSASSRPRRRRESREPRRRAYARSSARARRPSRPTPRTGSRAVETTTPQERYPHPGVAPPCHRAAAAEVPCQRWRRLLWPAPAALWPAPAAGAAAVVSPQAWLYDGDLQARAALSSL